MVTTNASFIFNLLKQMIGRDIGFVFPHHWNLNALTIQGWWMKVVLQVIFMGANFALLVDYRYCKNGIN